MNLFPSTPGGICTSPGIISPLAISPGVIPLNFYIYKKYFQKILWEKGITQA